MDVAICDPQIQLRASTSLSDARLRNALRKQAMLKLPLPPDGAGPG